MRGRTISVNVILENGVIRTLDPSLPVARSLAIAGDRIAGGVGTHETALASPDRVDLGGRCVVPGFTDSHVHFLLWSLSQGDIRLEGIGSAEEAVARVRERVEHAPRDAWVRGAGWRDADWPFPPTKELLDEKTQEVLAVIRGEAT